MQELSPEAASGGDKPLSESAEPLQLAAKKRKSMGASVTEHSEEAPAGFAPVPPHTDDGFDPTIILDPKSGKLRYKTEGERSATKIMPRTNPSSGEPVIIYTDGACRGNGQQGAIGGVGVFFGPQDPR
jgi:ribonuclease HI